MMRLNPVTSCKILLTVKVHSALKLVDYLVLSQGSSLVFN